MVHVPCDLFDTAKPNCIELAFENTYVTNSAGLHRFQDPEDNMIYLYTHLEPFFCNRWFPCFDQPSFRAPLLLEVVTPIKDWSVFGNASLKSKITAEAEVSDYLQKLNFKSTGGQTVHIFEDGPSISTYIYGMDAGPFTVVKNDQEFKVPMSIGIRKSKI